MSDLVRELIAEILVALMCSNKEDLLLLINNADFKHIAANEPKFMTYEKTLAGSEVRYFMGIRIQIVGDKSAPKITRRIC